MLHVVTRTRFEMYVNQVTFSENANTAEGSLRFCKAGFHVRNIKINGDCFVSSKQQFEGAKTRKRVSSSSAFLELDAGH